MTNAEWKKTRAYVEEVQMERREQEQHERERREQERREAAAVSKRQHPKATEPTSTMNASALAAAFIVLCLFFMTLGGVTTILKEREVRKVLADDVRRNQLEELNRMGRKLDAMDEKLDRILSHQR